MFRRRLCAIVCLLFVLTPALQAGVELDFRADRNRRLNRSTESAKSSSVRREERRIEKRSRGIPVVFRKSGNRESDGERDQRNDERGKKDDDKDKPVHRDEAKTGNEREPSAVPEPGSLAVWALGGALLLAITRRRTHELQ